MIASEKDQSQKIIITKLLAYDGLYNIDKEEVHNILRRKTIDMLVYQDKINLFSYTQHKFRPNYGMRGLAFATLGKIIGYLLLMRPDLTPFWICMHVPTVMISSRDYNLNRKIVTQIDIMNDGCCVILKTVEGRPLMVHASNINVYDKLEMEKLALHPLCKFYTPFYIGDESLTFWLPRGGIIRNNQAFRWVMNGYVLDF